MGCTQLLAHSMENLHCALSTGHLEIEMFGTNIAIVWVVRGLWHDWSAGKTYNQGSWCVSCLLFYHLAGNKLQSGIMMCKSSAFLSSGGKTHNHGSWCVSCLLLYHLAGNLQLGIMTWVSSAFLYHPLGKFTLRNHIIRAVFFCISSDMVISQYKFYFVIHSSIFIVMMRVGSQCTLWPLIGNKQQALTTQVVCIWQVVTSNTCLSSFCVTY